MKTSKMKQGKPYTIVSKNEKMDTSGMANQPVDLMDYMVEYKQPTMPLQDMVRKVSEKRMK
jgi:hypothetical protein